MRYPVRLINRHSIHHPFLYDVMGRLLMTPSGDYHSIHNPETREAFRRRDLRLVYNLSPGFRYFVTNSWDKEIFRNHREIGAKTKGIVYHVYYDEDIDLNYRTRYTILTRPQ